MITSNRYPLVDVFAGPGGLGEGFATAFDEYGHPRFQNVVSIEKEEFSFQTLLLRHFFRQFPNGEAPDAYYDFLGGKITENELFDRYKNEHVQAQQSVYKISLGSAEQFVTQIIRKRIAGSKCWALVGGPPCQAYSLVGRSRMKHRPDFEQDERHTLYREYLRIIATHRPPIFVMENVKGLLSATIEGKLTIKSIVRDLRRPSIYLNASTNLEYNLYSLSEEVNDGDVLDDPRLFVVRAEEYGVPQARHRMFILGVRSDLKVPRPKILFRGKSPTVRDMIGAREAARLQTFPDNYYFDDSRSAVFKQINNTS